MCKFEPTINLGQVITIIIALAGLWFAYVKLPELLEPKLATISKIAYKSGDSYKHYFQLNYTNIADVSARNIHLKLRVPEGMTIENACGKPEMLVLKKEFANNTASIILESLLPRETFNFIIEVNGEPIKDIYGNDISKATVYVCCELEESHGIENSKEGMVTKVIDQHEFLNASITC